MDLDDILEEKDPRPKVATLNRGLKRLHVVAYYKSRCTSLSLSRAICPCFDAWKFIIIFDTANRICLRISRGGERRRGTRGQDTARL